MSVKRYDVEAYSYFEATHWTLVESKSGDFMYASDYDELRVRVAWMMECEDWYNDCFMDGAYDGPSELDEVTLASRVSVEELL